MDEYETKKKELLHLYRSDKSSAEDRDKIIDQLSGDVQHNAGTLHNLYEDEHTTPENRQRIIGLLKPKHK